MYSDNGNGCSHPLGFPIRISPDHSLLATSRSFSQLIASFFAYLRQGIHTHALSSLTIKSTSHTRSITKHSKTLTCVLMPVNIQLSKISIASAISYIPAQQTADYCDTHDETSAVHDSVLVGLGGIEPPTSPLSGVRSSHLSYRPSLWSFLPHQPGGAGRDRTGDLLNANQALSHLSYSPSEYLIEASWMQWTEKSISSH